MPDAAPPTEDLAPLRSAGWLAVWVAVAILVLRAAAYSLTHSVAVLADTIDPLVNLVAAALTLAAVVHARRPADLRRTFGYRKLEFVTVGLQGAVSLLGAFVVLYAAWFQVSSQVQAAPTPTALALFAVSLAGDILLAVRLHRAGHTYASPALRAAARHALTDVALTAGVLLNLALVLARGWLWLDTVASVALAVVIVWQAAVLLRAAAHGLLDGSRPDLRQTVETVIGRHLSSWLVGYHDVRCRDAGDHAFIDFHLQFADGVSLELAHALAEHVEAEIERTLGSADALAHLEPASDLRPSRRHVRPELTPRERSRRRAALVSLCVAILLMAVKLLAAWLTRSAAVLSDALESVTNVLAASFAIFSVRLARSGSDERHPYGHQKIEFIAAGVEGALIALAAAAILVESWLALVHGPRLANLSHGLLLVALTAGANGLLGWYLLHTGRRLESLTLAADGRHVLADVYTSAGVVGGLLVVQVTGWAPADPLTAMVVACVVLYTGASLIFDALRGVLDSTETESYGEAKAVLDGAVTAGRVLGWHKLRLRDSGGSRFVEADVQFPDGTSLAHAHEVSEELEDELEAALAPADATLHVEPAAEVARPPVGSPEASG